jgi:hypothetical protein
MERNKKVIVGLVLTSLLVFSVVPYFNVSAQTCNPDALVPVKYGQRGAAVRNAQACLMEAGYNIASGATGHYGAQTRSAVKQFYADWYGSWNGNSLGTKGVAELKSRLAVAPAPSQPSSSQPPSSQPSQAQLQQVLTLISQGKTNEALALLLTLLGQQQSTQPSATPTSPTAEEGFLTVEQDPSVVAVTLRESETGKVFGLRMRADNGDVNAQSIFLRWATTSNAAPYRIISKVEVVDEQNNVLFSRNVDSTTFYQDTNLNYYLPVTGLNFNVPKNTYKSLFVRVTVVGTLPSGVNTAGFYVNQNDVRGVDGVGVQRFAPTQTISQNFNLQTNIAGQADWVVARNVNTPKEGYIFGSIVDGKLYGQKVLSIDVTAKYDSLRMTELKGAVNNTSTIAAVYLKYGSQTLASAVPNATNKTFTFNVTPANFTINKDQTVTLDIYADLSNGTTSPADATTTVTDVSGQNSLGDNRPKGSLSVASDVMHYLTVGPQFVFKTPTTQYTPPSQTASSSYQVTFEFDVTPVNGNIEMGTTTATTTAFVRLQKSDGTFPGVTPNVTTNIYQGSTDVTNSLTLSSNGLWVLSQGQTYTFKVTAAYNNTAALSGLHRWIVDELKWRNSAGPQTATWTERELLTSYTNLQ